MVVLEEELDRAKEFSVSGTLLENLSAHLHRGKTSRDRPYTLPSSPLSFGGPDTPLVADADMLNPLPNKKTGPSPLGKPPTGVDSNVSRTGTQPFDGGDSASSSPLWYETEAVLVCRELGSGDAMDMDSAKAVEKYVPDGSLANKDRIVDDLTAKNVHVPYWHSGRAFSLSEDEWARAWERPDAKLGTIKFLGGGDL
ncbi:hypothetical protein HanRHA438_Chr08g0366771 [Helianthus annuus]|nr:hypothetical protein HanOQP8_Chr08g0298921 [Helianthus annuus]KAJ0899285.1 hypothetical protein HanRHA438_Chr08g0366771 [Helianthus annuus]